MGAIQDEISANLQALGFTNPSSEAIYNAIANSVGGVLDNVIIELNNTESIIQNLLISQYAYGKPGYYTSAALAFQFGDDLIVNPAINPVTGAPYLNLIYPVIDQTKQIIAQAAFQTAVNGGSTLLFLKVATLLSGSLQPLSDVQFAAFSAYFLNFEIPGLSVSIISIAGNVLAFNATCTYFTSFDLSTLETNLNAALITFQDTFPFNGEFFSGDLQDYIKTNVPGVRDFFIFDTELDGVLFEGSQNLSAGYFNYGATSIDYVPYQT